MGYNIAGIVIDDNYEKDIKKLGTDLNWGIEIIEKTNFETASSNWTPKGEFRLHFTEKATMIFFPHEWVTEQYRSRINNTLNYAYSATAMAFQVDYFKSGSRIRTFFEHEGERNSEEGEPLELESEYKTADGLTFALIDKLLGESFRSINLEETSFRCKKTKYIPQLNAIQQQAKIKELARREEAKRKKWWQIWK